MLSGKAIIQTIGSGYHINPHDPADPREPWKKVFFSLRTLKALLNQR
jgi:hypothetical protein